MTYKHLGLVVFFAAACGEPSTPPPLGAIEQAVWINGDFESDSIGTMPPTGWTVDHFSNPTITDTRPNPQTLASLNLGAGGTAMTFVVGGSPETQNDPDVGAGGTLHYPKYGDRAARVNYLSQSAYGNNNNVNALTQTMTADLGDVDPTDDKVHVRFAIAPVLENPSHAYTQQPYYFVRLQNLSRGTTLYQDFNASGQPGVPWKNFTSSHAQPAQYTDWQMVDISPGNAALAVGDQLELKVIASGCSQGGHFGRVYVDAVGSGIPGLYTWATGVQQANAGSDITYTMNYKNGGTTTVTGATLNLVTPPNTTFQSFSNASCTAPSVGGTGTVSCSLGTLAPGATGTYTITVNVNAGTANGTLITNGNYSIFANGVSALIGPKVNTTVTSGVQYSDLSITKTDGVAAIGFGQPTTYTVVVSNAGPVDTTATVADTMPAQLTNVTWTCSAAGTGASCAASGSGNISDAVALPIGATLTYTISATIFSGSGTVTMVNTATVTATGPTTDPDSTNDTAVDTDTIGTLRTLTVTKQGTTTAGSVGSTPAAISCGTGCTSDNADFLDGSHVVLTATPITGGTFVGWGGACSGTATTCNVTMAGAQTVTATFADVPATTAVSSGSPQSTPVSTAFATALAVKVSDSNGTPVPGVTVSFAGPGSGARATLSAPTAVTDASGIASVTATANATAGAYTVTGSIAGVTPAASFSLINVGPPASIAVSSGDNQSATVDTAYANLVAVVLDAASQPVPGATVTFTAPGSGASATLGGSPATTNASGLATVTAVANTSAGSYTVTASVGGVATPASFSLTNTADVATTLLISSGDPQSATVATAFAAPLVVKAVDAFDNPVSGVHVSFGAPAGEPTGSASPTSATTDTSGLAQTSVLAGNGAGSYQVSASASGLLPVSFSLTNTAGAPATIAQTGGTGQSTVVHTAFAQPLTALVRDAFDNPVPGATVTFAAPASGASASVPAAVTDSSGVATSTATANATAGGYAVTASITGGASTIYVLNNLPGAPAMVTITGGDSQSATVGTAFAQAIDVVVVDDDGNAVPVATVTLTGPAGGAGIAGSPITLTTNALGVASSSVTANHTAGSYTVSASVSGVATVPTASLTNNPGTATTLAVVSGSGQHAAVTTAFASSLIVVATDTFGNVVPGTQVTFSAPATGATASLSPMTATTAGNGRASTAATAGTRSGSYSVTASITGASTAFALTNDHGPAAAIAVASGDAQSTTVNTAFTASLVAHVSDAQGNDVPGATVTFAAPVSGARATLGSPTATTNASGNAQTTATANTISGSYSVSASITGASTSFSLTNLAGTPVTVTITSGGPQTTMVGTVFTQPIAVRVLDLFDNPVPGAAVTLSGPATGPGLANSVGLITGAAGTASGSVTANHVAGTFALAAAVGGVVAASTVQMTNTPAAPASVAVVAGTSQHATVTTAFVNRLVVVVSDSFGNPVSGVTVTFSAPASGASATLSPTSGVTASNGRTNIAATANTRAGSYNVTASITGASTTFALTNDAGPPAAIAVASGGNQSTTVATAFAAPLVAHVTDSHGNDCPGAQVTFAAPATGARASLATPTATTNAGGLAQTTATAGQITGSYSVTATVTGAVPTSFSLTNTAGAVATMTATGGGGQSAVVVTAFAAPLAIHAADQFGNNVPGATITFSAPASGPSATFAGAGTATTGATGNAQIIATAGTVAGSYAAHAASGSAPPVSFALTNLPGAPAQIAAISGTPQSTVVATAFGLPLTVRVSDAHGNPVPETTVHFDPANTPATATPSAATATTDSSGVASVTATASTAAGSHDLTASIDGASAAFHLSNTADVPASIATVETASPQATTVLHGFARPLGVVVRDRFGNPAPGATVSYTAPDSGASAVLSAETATTDATGTAAVNATANATAGAYIARAAVDGATDTAPFALTNLADAAATLTIASGDPQSAVVNTDFAAPLVAQVRDNHGNPVPGVVVEFTAPTSDATATLAASSAISDAAGHAAIAAHASTTTGAYLVTAALADAASPVIFRLTNTAAAPATITASPSSTPQAAQVDHPFTQPLVAQVRDIYSNVVPGATVTFAAPATGATCALSSATAITESDGTASVTIDAGTTAGSYTVTASAPGVATPAEFALSNLAGEAHTISVGAGAPQSATVATAFATPLVALVQDSHGNPVPEVDVEFTAPASGPGATLDHATVTTGLDGKAATGLTAGTTAGDFTVTATAPQTAAPALFALTALAGAPATATAAASASPQSAEVGHSFAHPLAITVVDAFGNPVPNATVTYHAPTGPGAELSATTATTDASGAASVLAIADATAGSYTATASVAGAPGVSFALTNTPAEPSSVVITSGGAQHTLATTAFAAPVRARVVDAFGNPVPGATVTFTTPATGASATMSNAMPVTDEAGDVSITLIAGPVVGPFTLSATVPGALSAATTMLEVLAIPTTITAMAAATSPVDVAASVTITVSAAIGVPSGMVDVRDTDGKVLGSATLVAGAATISAAGLAMGHHMLLAHYAAQGSYAESTSTAVAIDITEDSGSLSGGGHGGCSTGGATGGWLAVVLAAVVLRRRRRALAGVVAAGLALHTGLASADPAGARAINRYHAASPESAWFALDSASFAGDGGVALSVVTDYAKDPLEIFDGDGAVREHIVTDTLTAQLGASVTLRDRFRLSSTVVMVPWQSGNGGTFNGMPLASPTYAFGDIIVAGDFRLYGAPHDPLRVVAGARFALPTGSRTNFTSDGTPGVEPHLQLAGSLGNLEYAGGASAFLRSSGQMARETFGHELRYQAALGARLLDSRLFVGPELFGAVPLEAGTAVGTPLEGQLGAHVTASRELRFGVAVGVGLINAIGEPRWRTLAQLAWTP